MAVVMIAAVSLVLATIPYYTIVREYKAEGRIRHDSIANSFLLDGNLYVRKRETEKGNTYACALNTQATDHPTYFLLSFYPCTSSSMDEWMDGYSP